VLAAARVARLRPEDAGLGVDVPDGRRLVRCLRCDAWAEVRPRPEAGAETLPALDELKLPRRGKDLRDAIILRLIAIDRGVHSVLFGLLAVALIALEVNFGSAQAKASAIIRALDQSLGQTGQADSSSFVATELEKFLSVRKGAVLVLAVTAVAYCLVEGIEAIGLWLERRWAEYLTAIATAGFLPFEVNELLKRVTVLRVVALVVNLAILVYLVWKKRLFGIRGGLKAERHETIDRRALFGPPAGAIRA
jgi:uncharacterized membrane protein (DUF2068 family)